MPAARLKDETDAEMVMRVFGDPVGLAAAQRHCALRSELDRRLPALRAEHQGRFVALTEKGDLVIGDSVKDVLTSIDERGCDRRSSALTYIEPEGRILVL